MPENERIPMCERHRKGLSCTLPEGHVEHESTDHQDRYGNRWTDEPQPENGVIEQSWPVPDLPNNVQRDEFEYGVFVDNTHRGLGIALMEVTRDAHKAATLRRVYGPKAHVRQRRVVYSHWSGAFYDDGSPLIPPESEVVE